MLFARIGCERCGASTLRAEGAMVVRCSHCGGFLGLGVLHSAERLAAAVRQQADPSKVEARIRMLGIELGRTAVDRDVWRALALEFHALHAAAHPEDLPDTFRGRGLQTWLEATVKNHELQVFNAAVVAAMSRLTTAYRQLYSAPDPVAAGRDVLAAAECFFGTVQAQPEYVPLPTDATPRALAEAQLGQAVRGATTLFGQALVERMFREVLGHERPKGEAHCRSCGAVLTEEALSRCRCSYCGAAQSVITDDAYAQALLALWGATQHHDPADGDRAMAALGFALSSMYAERDLPAPISVLSFLRAAVPEVGRHALVEKLGILELAHAKREGFAAWAASLREHLAGWSPSAEQRSAPSENGGGLLLRDAGDPDAWIELRLAEWRLVSGGVEPGLVATALVSLCLQTFWLGGSVRPETAARFISRSEPGISRGEIQRGCERWRLSQSRPEIQRFLTGLADLCAEPT